MKKFLKVPLLVLVLSVVFFGIPAFAINEVTCTDMTPTGSVSGGNATLEVPDGACPIEVSFSSYSHTGTIVPFEDQVLTDNITEIYGPGIYNIGPVDRACNWQTDLYWGPVQEHLLPNQGHANLIAYDFAENQTCEDNPEDTATISAIKIICDSESDLPNWGANGPDVTSSAASTFLTTHPNCHQTDWTFEWAPGDTTNPGDQNEVGGEAWTTFSGTATVPAGDKIWVREQFDNDYIPFTGVNTTQDVSAELYCHNDVLNYDNYDWVDPVVAEQTYHCIGFNVLVEEEPVDVCPNLPENQTEVPQGYRLVEGQCVPIVSNSCPVASTLGDNTIETINAGSEETLQSILDGEGYGLNVTSDQKQYQLWNVPANEELIIDSKFIDGISAHQSVFGYYKDGSMANFIPIFKNAAIVGYESVPMGNAGPFTINTGGATSIGFAIKSFANNNQVGVFATENSLSTGSDDQVVVYNPGTNKYVIAYEDWVDGDFDYQDLIVEINLDCGDLGGGDENSAPTSNAGPDQIITLPTNSVNLNGTGTDSDGTIASYTWSFVSGPSVVDPSDVEDPAISGLVAGTYVFKLTVTDNDGATGEDTVQITVNPAVINPQCSDGTDNDGDQLVDTSDPGCHTDGNASNTGSYNPNDNNETNVPACSNTGDDDGDQLIDALDPGCHSDGNASNESSYDPNDNDETNTPITECSDGIDNDDDGTIDFPQDPGCDSQTDNDESNGGSHHRSSGGRVAPVGQVLAAQTSCGIYVDKFLRKGYQNNVDAVKEVQQFLNDYRNAGLVVDGIYGSLTETAVSNFQLASRDRVLTPWGISAPTGIFYLTTQTEVNNIMCPTLGLPIPTNLIPFSTNLQAPMALMATGNYSNTSLFLNI